MRLSDRFTAYIRKENLFTQKDLLLLAVSGGLDSVVLAELCHQAGYSFVIAHCNFQLRGEESERDEQFVNTLARRYNVPVLVHHFDTAAYAETNKVSIQVAARELRYRWFQEILQGKHHQPATSSPATASLPATPNVLLTAHHLDDNIETLLLKFFKGTGIAGLHGILPLQGKLARPLLFARKIELAAFAAMEHLTWVEDSSNTQDKYARNYLRRQVLPLLEKLYPEVVNNLADNITRFREIEMLYQQSVDLHKKKLLEHKGKEVHIPVLKLKKHEPLSTILYEIVKPYDFTPAQLPEIIALLDSESGRFIASATHRIIRNRAWLIIAPIESAGVVNILVEEGKREIVFAHGLLRLQRTAANGQEPPAAANIACIDAKLLNFPLLLRPWKAGDYFYPLGMLKKKKVARFLIDQKVSKTDKEKVWVLESNRKIIWIVGHRIDDRVKMTAATAEMVRIELHPA